MDLLPSLLLDIEANPGDETPWLVLADWLDDQGEGDRAELTRLSVELRRAGFTVRPGNNAARQGIAAVAARLRAGRLRVERWLGYDNEALWTRLF